MTERIALLSAYSRHNTGDWLLIKHALELIEARHPGAEITVIAADDASIRDLGPRITVAPSPVRIACAQKDIPRYTLHLLSGGRRGTNPGVTAIRRASHAYTVGGGYLQFRAPREVAAVSLVHLSQAREARKAGVPLTMLPQSVGPFTGKLQRRLARRILGWFPGVNVREAVSAQHVRELMPEAAVHRLPDLVFWEDARRSTGPPADTPRARVGLVVRNWWFPADPDPASAQERYLHAFAALADRLVAQGHEPVLVVHADGPTDRGDDRIASRRVQELASSPIATTEVTSTSDLDAVRSVYGALDVAVSTRMHAALIAIGQGVPTVCVGYEWKARGIFADLGIERYVTPIDQLDLSAVLDLVADPSTWPAADVRHAWHGEHLRLREAFDPAYSPTAAGRP